MNNQQRPEPFRYEQSERNTRGAGGADCECRAQRAQEIGDAPNEWPRNQPDDGSEPEEQPELRSRQTSPLEETRPERRCNPESGIQCGVEDDKRRQNPETARMHTKKSSGLGGINQSVAIPRSRRMGWLSKREPGLIPNVLFVGEVKRDWLIAMPSPVLPSMLEFHMIEVMK